MIKKELKIFIVIFTILTALMHYKEFLSHPIEHILALSSSGAYGIGAIHPLFFTLIVYLVVLVPRMILKLFKKKA
jgi:hypothetical protein